MVEARLAFHNIIAHPLCGLLHLVGLVFPPAGRLGRILHDITAPEGD